MATWRMVPAAPYQIQALTAIYKDPKILKTLTGEEWESLKKEWLASMKAASRKSPKSTT